MDYVLWHSYFIFWLRAWCDALALSTLTNGCEPKWPKSLICLCHLSATIHRPSHLCFLLVKPWSRGLYQTTVLHVGITACSIQEVVTCFRYMDEPVSTSNFNLFMVSRRADRGIKKNWGSVRILFSSLSPAPSLFFPLCFSLCLFSLHKYRSWFVFIQKPGVRTVC